MACASSLLSEDKFLCSVCLEVFTDPVSTPCGHNFCSSCIKTYWDSADFCQCPLCNQKFYPRPQLQVNTVMSELAADFKALVQIKESTPDPQGPDLPETTGVLCDYCTDMKREAVKSCLSCLISYCDVHLEPHRRVKVLKGHTLSGPLKSLENRMCSIHSKIEDLYCRTDQTCVCVVCIKNSHKSHDVVPLKEEYEALRVKRDETKENIRKMIESRSKKVAEIENSLDVCEKEAKKEEEASVQAFTDLICCLQERQSELVEAIEERYRATRQRAEGFLSELKMEIAELENRSRKLKELTQSKDHHHFLQSFPMLCSPLSSDWIKFKVHSDLSFEGVRRTLIPLKQKADRITENLPEITMKRIREHAVDLTFDPDTAYCTLVISQDGKKVMDSGKDQNYTPKPKRFESSEEVLAKQHLTGISYYEVQVKGIRGWLLGVARESVDTQTSEYQSVQLGYWTIGLLDGTYYSFSSPKSPIKVKEKLEKVGIFVDYDRGVVSFYDVNYKSHIYSFINCNFKRKLYPYFCLSDSLVGVPLIITPVP